MRTKGIGPNGLGVSKGSPFKLDPITAIKVAGLAKSAMKMSDAKSPSQVNSEANLAGDMIKGGGGAMTKEEAEKRRQNEGKKSTTTSKRVNPKDLDVNDPFAGVPFKGANSSNSSCWKGYKKVGTKKSPTNPGVTVNDCKKI